MFAIGSLSESAWAIKWDGSDWFTRTRTYGETICLCANMVANRTVKSPPLCRQNQEITVCAITILAVTAILVQHTEGVVTTTDEDDPIPSTADERKTCRTIPTVTSIRLIPLHILLHEHSRRTDRTQPDEIHPRVRQDLPWTVITRPIDLPHNAEILPLVCRDRISSGNNLLSDHHSKDNTHLIVPRHNALTRPFQLQPAPLHPLSNPRFNLQRPTPTHSSVRSKRCGTNSTLNTPLS